MSVALLSRATVVAFGFKSQPSSSLFRPIPPSPSMSMSDASRGRQQGALRGGREGLVGGGTRRAESHAVFCYKSPFFASDQTAQAQTALIVLNTPFQTRRSHDEDGEEDLPGVLRVLWKASSYRVCADGGANRLFDAVESARRRHDTDDDDHPEWTPDLVTGDLDSIRPEVRQFYESRGVSIIPVEDQDLHDLDVSVQVPPLRLFLCKKLTVSSRNHSLRSRDGLLQEHQTSRGYSFMVDLEGDLTRRWHA